MSVLFAGIAWIPGIRLILAFSCFLWIPGFKVRLNNSCGSWVPDVEALLHIVMPSTDSKNLINLLHLNITRILGIELISKMLCNAWIPGIQLRVMICCIPRIPRIDFIRLLV